MTTITIEKEFNFGKTNFKDVLELAKYLAGNLEEFVLKKYDLKMKFENFSEEENKSLVLKGGETINNIFKSLDSQLGK